jgi:hypothetical protein
MVRIKAAVIPRKLIREILNEYVEVLSIDTDHLYIYKIELKNYFGDRENPTARCTLTSEETVCM